MSILKKVNAAIKARYKLREGFQSQVTKNKVPSFTRHNGHKLKRLKPSWRSPRGLQYNRSITEPKIGYKRPPEQRFVLPDGTIAVRVYNEADLTLLKELNEYERTVSDQYLPNIYKTICNFSLRSTYQRLKKSILASSSAPATPTRKIKLVAVIGRTVGARKRHALLDISEKLGLYIKLTS